MLSRNELLKEVKKWQSGEISNWKISNWAVSKIFLEEEFEDPVVEELVAMISNVGADMDFCTSLSPSQYLTLIETTNNDSESLEEELENIEGELDEELENLYPDKGEFLNALEDCGWFEGCEEIKQKCSELIQFQGIPNLEDQYFLYQEIFWLRLVLPSAVYNEMEDGNIIEEFNFDFISQLDPVSNVSKFSSNGTYDDTISFQLLEKDYCIQLDLENDPEEILSDFFTKFKEFLSEANWELIYSDTFMEPGDLMFLILVDKNKLQKACEAGAVRSMGEETSQF